MQWARGASKLTLDDERFRDAVAELAAPLHGLQKDELVGEDNRQHRRTMRLARAAIGMLVDLVVAAAVAAVVALHQSSVATHQRNEARAQARLALAREVAATAVSQLPVDRQRSVLLGLESVRIKPTPQGEAALRQALLSHRAARLVSRHRGAVESVTLSPDGRLAASAGVDGKVQLSDVHRLRPVSYFHLAGLTAASFSPDGRLIATGSDFGRAQLWDVHTARLVITLPFLIGSVNSVNFSPDGRAVATAGIDGARVWDIATRKRVFFPVRVGAELLSVTFSPDARRLLTVNPTKVTLWNLYPTRRLRTIQPRTKVVTANLSGDGKDIVVITADEAVRVWGLSGRSQLVLPGHAGHVSSAALSSNGALLVTAEGQVLRVWQLSTGQPVAVFREARGNFTAAGFDLTGRTILAGDTRGGVWMYPCEVCAAPLSQLKAQARRQVKRTLTRDERIKYLHRQ